MNGWRRWAIYTAAVRVGALIISLAVAEWREPDLSQIESDLRELRGATPIVVSGGSVTPTPNGGSITPREADSEGAHYTVSDVRPGRVEFILEGPHPGGLAQNFTVIDEEDFVCTAGINASPAAPLLEGQKAPFWIEYTCREGAKPKELRIDDLVFEFEFD